MKADPYLVQPGWESSAYIPGVAAPDSRVLFYPDGSARWEHRCTYNGHLRVTAPLLSSHTITQRDPLTITPSIHCTDCGSHGHITNGRWSGHIFDALHPEVKP